MPTTLSPKRRQRLVRTRYAIAGLTFSIGMTLMGTGLLGSLLGVRSELAGISAGIMGVANALYYVGFVIGIPVLNRALEVLSRRRLFAACTIGMGVAATCYGLAVEPAPWLVLRLMTGFGLAGCYLVVETWLNDLAHNDVRGKVMGFYVACAAGGMAVGQLILSWTNPSSWTSFAIAGVITGIAWLPILTVHIRADATHSREEAMSVREVARAVPSGVIGFVLVGLTQGCLLTMAAVYAARAGLDAGQVGIFVGAITAGAIVLQLPVGAIADRRSRRGVMIVMCTMSTLLCLALLGAEPGTASFYALAFALGGCSAPLYALGSSYTYDWLPREHVVSASTALLITYSLGAVAGPLLAAAMMTAVGVAGFFWALIIGHVALGGFMAVRVIVSPDPVALTAQVD